MVGPWNPLLNMLDLESNLLTNTKTFPWTSYPIKLETISGGTQTFLKKCFMACCTSPLYFIGKMWVYPKYVTNTWAQVKLRLLLLLFSAKDVLMKMSAVTWLYRSMQSFVLNLQSILGLSQDLISNSAVSSIVDLATSKLIIHLAANLSTGTSFQSPLYKDS